MAKMLEQEGAVRKVRGKESERNKRTGEIFMEETDLKDCRSKTEKAPKRVVCRKGRKRG